MSTTLAAMLRKSTDVYRERWVAKSESDFATEARDDVVSEHLVYWDAIVRAVESTDFEELLNYSREAGRSRPWSPGRAWPFSTPAHTAR